MKYHTTVFMGSLISIFLLISFMAMAQVAPDPATPIAVTEQEARIFVEEYTKRFTKMDLESYMALFSERAVENRALPYADIRWAYQQTIQRTHFIQYEYRILTIQTYSDRAFVSGRYRLTQTFKGGRVRNFQGNIQWALIREGDVLKIREINYGIDR